MNNRGMSLPLMAATMILLGLAIGKQQANTQLQTELKTKQAQIACLVNAEQSAVSKCLELKHKEIN